MNQGWITIHRGIVNHWIYQDEKYFRYWMTILLYVNHTESKFPIDGELVACNPGESFRSIQSWTDLFGCSKKTTLKFFLLLENDGMITRKILGKGNRRKHLLTVRNWDKYQNRKPKSTPKSTPKGNRKDTPNNNDEYNNNEYNNDTYIKIKKEKSISDNWDSIILSWLKYKKEKKQSYQETGMKAMVTKLLELSDNNPDKGMEIVNNSMANGYSGLFAPKPNGKRSPQAEPLPTAADHKIKTEEFFKSK